MAKLLKLAIVAIILTAINAQVQAVTLYECKGGVLAQDPKDC